MVMLVGNTAAAEPSMAIAIDLFPGSEQISSTYFDFEAYRLALSIPVSAEKGYVSEISRKLEGRVYRRDFFVRGDKSAPFEIFTNYRDALLQRGLEIVFECTRRECGIGKSAWSGPLANVLATNVVPEQQYYLVARLGDPEIYVVLFVKGQFGGVGIEYMLDLIEPKAMEKGRVTISVDEMIVAIERSGKVAIYDIYFDTGKAILKPESNSVLGHIVTLLSRRPALSLYIVGHTDDTGGLALNRELSERRARSVVDALVMRGIQADRLLAFGAGPFAPVATNRDDRGRATNRRVELVERLAN